MLDGLKKTRIPQGPSENQNPSSDRPGQMRSYCRGTCKRGSLPGFSLFLIAYLISLPGDEHFPLETNKHKYAFSVIY